MAGADKLCSRCSTVKLATEFHVRASRCKVCSCEVSRDWRRANSERAKLSVAAWKSRHEDFPFYRKRAHLKHRYGVTPEQCQQMMVSQKNACAVCKQDFSATPHVDHCHVTQKVRGLLCDRCNRGLGYFKDNPEFLRSGAAYIESAKK